MNWRERVWGRGAFQAEGRMCTQSLRQGVARCLD